jgi:predicted neutral ceramidase superfamily lipid hydrolase
MACKMKLMKKDRRKKEIKLRKKFFLTVLLTIFLWILLVALILLTDPTNPGIMPLFFLLAFLALTFTFSIIFINTRRGVILSTVITVLILLRYLGVGNILNLLLLAGVGVATEFYFSNR